MQAGKESLFVELWKTCVVDSMVRGKNTLRRTDGLNVRNVVVTFKSGLKECIQNCSGGSGLGYIRLWILSWKDLWRLRIVAMVYRYGV